MRPELWKPIRVYRNGLLFGDYRSCTDATLDVLVEEAGRSFGAVMLGLRSQANGLRRTPYLGRWTAQWA